MSLKNCVYPLQKISVKSDEGQIGFCVSLFFLLFLSVLLAAQLQLEQVRASDAYLQDALAASGLACALIDIREYGSTHEVRIPDVQEAYRQYCISLRANLGLDENWNCANRNMISGIVRLENYIVYNVQGDQVEIHRISQGREETARGRLGAVQAPNGQIIEHTGIYSEISYPLKGVLGLNVQARKGKLVDIVGEN